MKKILALSAVILAFVLCVGCKGQKGDIPIQKLSWTVSQSTQDGHSYVTFQMTNNTDITLQNTVMSFHLKSDVTQKDKDHFLNALQESKGFTDAFMQDYIRDLEAKNIELSMIATVPAPLLPGTACEPQRCYYMGGMSSTDVIFYELFEPYSLYLIYEKDGVQYSQTYNFQEKSYQIAPLEPQP